MPLDNPLYIDAGIQREQFVEKSTTYQSSWSRFWQSLQETQTYTQLIDISSHNVVSLDDWRILKNAGVKGVYIRYFIGTRLDNSFLVHLSRAVDVGMESIGAYGVPFDNVDYKIARDHFLTAEDIIRTRTDGYVLPSWNDVELTYVNTVSARKQFHTSLISSVPRMEIYSAAWFWDQYLSGVPFTGVKKCVANYTSNNTPWLPRDWSMEDIGYWQYNIWKKYPWHDISFAPIPYALDQDRFYGTEEELKAKAGYVTTPPNDLEDRVEQNEADIREINQRLLILEAQYHSHTHGTGKPQ